ncbi:MAG TPA: hypothetical protein EYP85_15595 [Armatimonadetes bacterium]|nr:hypothetical protein [Armatimonadota bacterium]
MTSTVLLSGLLAWTWLAGVSKAEGPLPFPDWGGQAANLMAKFYLWDAQQNEGGGRSDAKTSGGLGWGEGPFLMNYILAYRALPDTYWLDKVIAHFDRMVDNLSDPDGDGFWGWRDVRYLVGIVRARPRAKAEGATLEPPEQRPYVIRGGDRVTGHTYRLTFTTPDTFRLLDLTTGEVLAENVPYQEGKPFTLIPGAKFTLRGHPVSGTTFEIETVQPQEIEYVVHDGMVTYPIAQFIEIALTDETLPEQYRAKAEEYLQLLDRHFRQKWERYWVDLPNGAGAYTFTGNPTERFPGYLLPHNQYLALGRTWLVLQAVPGVPQREVYRDRAAKMARYFKRHLRLNGEAYLWNYWDPRPGENIRRHPEDVSHATIDIGFAVEACQRGIVFTPQDLRRFARTFTEVMWNGSWENPLFGRNVSTNEGGKRAFWEWAKLSLWDERVWQVAQAAFLKMGQPPNLTPTLLYLLAKRKGIPPSEKERWLQLRKKQ